SRRFRPAFRGPLGRAGHGVRHGRRHHRRGAPPRPGGKGGTQGQAIGRSKGGMTAKILALTDALGNLVRFVPLPGRRFDTAGVPPLLDGLSFAALIADEAFDSNAVLAELDERGAKVVISQHPRRSSPRPIDAETYEWRHLIEDFFCKTKEFKRVARRSDKTDESFSALPSISSARHPRAVEWERGAGTAAECAANHA
ncbi:MAG TPA: transposase, partial [Gemmatimonadales bacterium]|nr:transposase [Gemmatimonadales bacterium]